MDDANIDVIIRGIIDYKAILLLGPQFAINNRGLRINELLRARFNEKGYKIDEEFQNMYIPTKAPINKYTAQTILANFYDDKVNASRNVVYDNLAKLQFSAVINFSHDRFLPDAFKDKHANYDFSYFNNLPPKLENSTTNPDRVTTYIFNLLGLYTDDQSLITDYGLFYFFLTKLLSDDGFFNPTLATLVKNARAFILLGFDLKKWYVPLLLSKLIDKKADPIVLASTSDTNTKNKEYLEWLRRYPLKIDTVTADSYTFINETLLSKLPGPPPRPFNPNGECKILFVESNPIGTTKLENTFEFKSLENSMLRAVAGYKLLNPLLSATIDEIQVRLRKDAPTIIHLSVHGNEDGLIINDANNKDINLSEDVLKGIFSNPADSILCSFLSACWSDQHARRISRYSRFAIGMVGEIETGAASQFTSSFYTNLCGSLPIAIDLAFAAALNSLKATFPHQAGSPTLWRNGEPIIAQ